MRVVAPAGLHDLKQSRDALRGAGASHEPDRGLALAGAGCQPAAAAGAAGRHAGWQRVEYAVGGGVPGGGTCATHQDHRIAMAFICLGMASKKPVSIDDGRPIVTSFPSFETLMADLGAQIVRANR